LRLTRHLAAALGASVLLLGYSPRARATSQCVAAATNAQDLRAANKLRDARAALLVCSRATCNNVVRADCEKWLKEVDEQLPSLIVRTLDSRGREVNGAKVFIDDAAVELDGTPIILDPGQHVVRAKSNSGAVAEQKTLVVLGEKSRVLELRFEDETRRSSEPSPKEKPKDPNDDIQPSTSSDGNAPSNALPFALVGVGVVALGVFGYFEIKGQSGYSGLEEGCAQKHSCTSDQVDSVKSQFLAAGVAMAVAGVALVAAALVFFTRDPSPPKTAHTSGLRLQGTGLVF
jgi:hypothetical protein